MKVRLLPLLLALVLATPVLAAEKKIILKATPERVFEAAQKVVKNLEKERWWVQSIDETKQLIAIERPTSMTRVGLRATIRVERDASLRAIVTIRAEKSQGLSAGWADDNQVKKIAKLIEQEITRMAKHE